jgi:hypothetical protein
MSASNRTQSTTFNVGWLVLFGISVLNVLSYMALFFVVPNGVWLIGWATFSLYFVVVVLIPYRRGERWAWYLTWAVVVPAVVSSEMLGGAWCSWPRSPSSVCRRGPMRMSRHHDQAVDPSSADAGPRNLRVCDAPRLPPATLSPREAHPIAMPGRDR